MRKLFLSVLLIIACLTQASGNPFLSLMTGSVSSGGASYGVGDLLTERWGSQGTWSETTEGTYTISYTDTTYTDTGFVGSQLKTITGTSSQAYVTKSLASAQSAVYFRFYYILASDGFSDGHDEVIFNLAPNGQNIGDTTYIYIKLTKTSGQMYLRGFIADESGWDSGAGDLAISTGTVYKIEGYVRDDGSDGSAEWKVNGTARGTKTGLAAFGTVSIQNVNMGISYGGGAITHHFDTFDLDSSGYLSDS